MEQSREENRNLQALFAEHFKLLSKIHYRYLKQDIDSFRTQLEDFCNNLDKLIAEKKLKDTKVPLKNASEELIKKYNYQIDYELSLKNIFKGVASLSGLSAILFLGYPLFILSNIPATVYIWTICAFSIKLGLASLGLFVISLLISNFLDNSKTENLEKFVSETNTTLENITDSNTAVVLRSA